MNISGFVRVNANEAIKHWIDEQIALCDCVVVLIGATTATCKWVLYEIEKAYELMRVLSEYMYIKLKTE